MASRTRGRAPTTVCLEIGSKRVFASALDWPGWSRSGRTEEEALERLARYRPRYAEVPSRAGLPFPASVADSFEIVERMPGSAATDFGVPGAAARAELRPVSAAAGRRQAALVSAAWAVFDEAAATAPPELRKGPRGGGRDRDAIIRHVLESEAAYARTLGIREKPPAIDDIAAIEALREAIATVLATPSDGAALTPKGWPIRYAARRIAWHVLDHAWEMQDRTEPAS